MTTFGRSYEKENKGNYAAGTTALLYIAYNRGNLNRAALAYISFALGDYRPKAENEAFLETAEGEALEYRKTQGYKGHVNLYLYKDRYAQLSTAVNFRPFTPGYQEHIMQATLDMTAQMYVSHPGEVQPYGQRQAQLLGGERHAASGGPVPEPGDYDVPSGPGAPGGFYPRLRTADGIFFLYRRGVHGGGLQGRRLCGRPGGQRTENGGERAVPVPGV